MSDFRRRVPRSHARQEGARRRQYGIGRQHRSSRPGKTACARRTQSSPDEKYSRWPRRGTRRRPCPHCSQNGGHCLHQRCNLLQGCLPHPCLTWALLCCAHQESTLTMGCPWTFAYWKLTAGCPWVRTVPLPGGITTRVRGTQWICPPLPDTPMVILPLR